MDFWKRIFVQEFKMESLADELMDLIDEDKLLDFIFEKINSEISDIEMIKILSSELNAEEIADCLEELGHDVGHLTCKKCGYKQYDRETVMTYAMDNPDEYYHDIDYMCGACMDKEKDE